MNLKNSKEDYVVQFVGRKGVGRNDVIVFQCQQVK